MAKKFKYRFEPMLKVREHKEKERQKELAEAQGQVVEQKGKLTELDKHRVSTFDHQRKKLIGNISVAETLVCSRYLVRLKRDRIAGTEFLRGLEREVEKRRQKLVEAAKERKMYELLKEKQKTRHRKEIEKVEQKDLDEISTNTFLRQRANSKKTA